MPAAFKWTGEEIQDMVTSYKRGETAKSIAMRYGTSSQVILPVLEKQGITRRTNREAARRHTCDYRYFQIIDTEEKAYWLGFMTADGCITKGKASGDSPRITLHLGKQDCEHLAKLKQALQASQTISRDEHQCSLTIISTEMAADLAKHGILPRKTFSTKPAQVAPELVRHYWRGIIDGDGYVSKVGGTLVLVGDYDVVSSFQAFVLTQCPQVKVAIFRDGTIHTLKLTGKTARRMLEILYGEARVYLTRKYERVHLT